MNAPLVAAWIACALLAALTVFQVSLIAGAPLGHFAWGGQHRVLPPRLRVGSATSIVLYALFAWILLERAGVTGVFGPAAWIRIAAWVLVAYLALGVGMNALSRSKPERYTMTPVAAVLLMTALIVALG